MSNVKNLQAFGKLMGYCTGFEGKYNPGQQNLQVNALATLLNNAQQAIHGVRQAETAYDNATNHRERLLRDSQALATQAVAILRSTGVDALTLQDAYSSLRKLQKRMLVTRPATAATEAAGETPARQRTARGLDYVSQTRNFASLLETISKVPAYQPNESNLSISGLKKRLNELVNANLRVAQAEVTLTLARQHRDRVMYVEAGNLYDTAMATKRYVQGIFGTRSAEFRAVSGISFTKPV